ncbi:MAG: LamG-like jellyroll fold domain-containing protein, partial [Candidatus Methanosuratincola petrocarbonis]
RVMGRYYYGYSLAVSRASSIAWNVYTTPTGNNVVYRSPSVNPLWYVDYMLALTYDGAIIKRYENTNLINSTNQTEPLAQTASPWEVGADGYHQTNTLFYGIIYDAAIYSVALTQDEINTIYAGGAVTRGLVARITPGSWNGTVFVDLSGNGNHGTPYGNVQYKVVKSEGFSVSTVHSYSVEVGGDTLTIISSHPLGSYGIVTGLRYLPQYGQLQIPVSEGYVVVRNEWGLPTITSVDGRGAITDEYLGNMTTDPLSLTFPNIPGSGVILINFEPEVIEHRYNESDSAAGELVALDWWDATRGLFSLSLGSLFMVGLTLAFMFLTAVKFQHIGASAALGAFLYAVFFAYMDDTSRLFLGLAIGGFVAYALYQAYSREDYPG